MARDVCLSVESVSKTFKTRGNSILAVSNVDLVLHAGEFLSIVGPSGCGKSTLLNMMAGIEEVTSGKIVIANSAPGSLGYVTQRDSLLPWRSLLSNVELGLELRGTPVPERRERVREWLRLVGLEGFEEHFPDQLSGGMRQRASLVRTLAYGPKLLLLDEPFGALDAQTRVSLQTELLALWARAAVPAILVTHDIGEAICLSDRIILMSPRPGQIAGEYLVPLPRPRPSPIELWKTDEFRQLSDRLWADLSKVAGERGFGRD